MKKYLVPCGLIVGLAILIREFYFHPAVAVVAVFAFASVRRMTMRWLAITLLVPMIPRNARRGIKRWFMRNIYLPFERVVTTSWGWWNNRGWYTKILLGIPGILLGIPFVILLLVVMRLFFVPFPEWALVWLRTFLVYTTLGKNIFRWIDRWIPEDFLRMARRAEWKAKRRMVRLRSRIGKKCTPRS